RDPKATKQALLEAAFEEMHRYGFQGTSISSILQRTGMTKGALFHHYPSKLALAYAVLDEVIEPMIVDIWLVPLDSRDDPIGALQDLLRSSVKRMSDHLGRNALLLGCPLNHLAQEMSPLDEGFKDRCNRIFSRWQSGITGVLVDGQDKGLVRMDVDAENTAMFLIASIEGAISMGKRTQSLARCLEALQGSGEHLALYLEGLRKN
ncbi:MAG: TetR/AcrR family transcriptional regulator, partial [Mariprofundaceae bacterium]